MDTEWKSPRWRSIVCYRSDNGIIDLEYYLDELEDLHDIVELGPHWDTIVKIEIFRVFHVQDETMTIESATRY